MVSWVEQSAIVKPEAVPPLTASAHRLNWMSQDRCLAAASLTKVFPLTSKGRVESPELVTAGAAMPPRALELPLDADVVAPAADAVVVAEALATLAAVLLLSELLLAELLPLVLLDEVAVSAAASTVTVPVTTETQGEDEAEAAAAATLPPLFLLPELPELAPLPELVPFVPVDPPEVAPLVEVATSEAATLVAVAPLAAAASLDELALVPPLFLLLLLLDPVAALDAVAAFVVETVLLDCATMAPGPAATADAAAAAAASPPDWLLAAAFAVVPVPETVNLVQSSALPRWATGMRTGWWLDDAAKVQTR